MHNLNNAFAQLKLNCQSSTTLMLIKALGGSSLSLKAVEVFDEISDYPVDIISAAQKREKIVADLLSKALTSVTKAED
jgi:hypothetical protein